ncbi:MAG: hypothetical protein Q7T18_10520, partial [Sedimentisphaerales bacterium]|nr:hypothetical protein [Sedimentisphaerales bacterium]
IKAQNWPGTLREKFAEIERLQKEYKDKPPVFIPRSGDRSRATQQPGAIPGMQGAPGMGIPGMPGMPGMGIPH